MERRFAPSLILNILRYPKFSETQKGRTLYEYFRYCEKTNLRRKVVIPPFSYAKNFFDTRRFLRNRGFSYQVFRYCEKTNIRRKLLMPSLLSVTLFYNRILCETQKGSFEKFLGNVRQKIIDRNSCSPPSQSLLSIKVFDFRKFLKYRGFPYEVCQSCESTKFRQKGAMPPLLSLIFFDSRNFPKHKKDGPCTNLFATVRHHIFDGKSCFPLFLIHKNCLIPESF